MALKDLIARLTGKSKPAPTSGVTPAGTPSTVPPPADTTPADTIPADTPPVATAPTAGEIERMLRDYLREVNEVALRLRREPWEHRSKDYTAGQVILDAPPPTQAAVVRAVVERLQQLRWKWSPEFSRLTTLLEDLLRRRLPLSADDHRFFLGTAFSKRYPSAMIRMVEQYAEEHGLPEETRVLLQRLRFAPDAEGRRLEARVDTLLGKDPPLPLQPGERWTDAALAYLSALEPSARSAWDELLGHAFTASASKPSGKWLKEADARLESVGHDCFREQVLQWLELSAEQPDQMLNEGNAEVLKGLVWCCRPFSEVSVARGVGAAADSSYRKVAGCGPRSEKVGNACVVTLAGMTGPEPIAQLSRLQLRVKHRPALKLIEKALAEASGRAGVTPDELTERSVPTFGMRTPGVLEHSIGDYSAVIEITGTHSVEWRWRSAEGKLQKSAPAAVKEGHAEELKALKKNVAELQKLLPAQRDRLERLLLTERSWSLAEWREHYLEHPLLAPLARRLIWHLQSGDRSLLAIRHEGRLTDGTGKPVTELSDETRVRLWHPIGFAPEEVLRWRVWLEEHGVTQPFKQAHREVYLLTEAELNTGTYSNRFAAHLLKQHQFKALCTARGWEYHLQGCWDSGHEPMARLRLPGWGLRAEYWVEALHDQEGMGATGATYVSTDQVRFYREDETTPLPLTEVPALVFTEVMRDVDLFVGVASVGNDPAWRDSGGQPGYRDYWTHYSFGDLSASAVTRRDVLERLLPRLKIRDRCSLEGKFLRVRGDLRNYKIHLGSGNILMEPNDQYLCIVPDQSSARNQADNLFLPFEGDRMLSIVLSKAFLLAEDRKISDPTITRQICHHA